MVNPVNNQTVNAAQPQLAHRTLLQRLSFQLARLSCITPRAATLPGRVSPAQSLRDHSSHSVISSIIPSSIENLDLSVLTTSVDDITERYVCENNNPANSYYGFVDRNNKPQGVGTLTYQSDNSFFKYEGNFLGGQFHGQGILTSSTLRTYVLSSTQKIKDLIEFEGVFDSGQPSGPGKLTVNGSDYKADFSGSTFKKESKEIPPAASAKLKQLLKQNIPCPEIGTEAGGRLDQAVDSDATLPISNLSGDKKRLSTIFEASYESTSYESTVEGNAGDSIVEDGALPAPAHNHPSIRNNEIDVTSLAADGVSGISERKDPPGRVVASDIRKDPPGRGESQ